MKHAYVTFIDGIFTVSLADTRAEAIDLAVKDAVGAGDDFETARKAYEQDGVFETDTGSSAVVPVSEYPTSKLI